MDQTKRLYHLLKLSNKVPDVNKLIIDIEDAISKGAKLCESYYDEVRIKLYMPPIYYMIHTTNHSMHIIHLLKKHWWDPDAMFEMEYMYFEDENDEKSFNMQLIIADATVFFNILYSHAKSSLNLNVTFKDIYDEFNPHIIEEDKLRHQYIMSYRIIPDYNIDV